MPRRRTGRQGGTKATKGPRTGNIPANCGKPSPGNQPRPKRLAAPPCDGAICQNSDFILLSRRDCVSLSATKHHILILKTTHLMLKTILAIAGKPGLYRLVSRGKNMLIVESVSDKKRFPAYGNEKIISLDDIAMYTNEEDVPLRKVLASMKEKENGATATIDLKTASAQDLYDYLTAVLPTLTANGYTPPTSRNSSRGTTCSSAQEWPTSRSRKSRKPTNRTEAEGPTSTQRELPASTESTRVRQ